MKHAIANLVYALSLRGKSRDEVSSPIVECVEGEGHLSTRIGGGNRGR